MSTVHPMRSVTKQIGDWLHREPHSLFDAASHAACALLTDWEHVLKLNQDARREGVEYIQGVVGWPDDEWIIGEDGRGGSYLVSRTGRYTGVHYYDHEICAIEDHQPTLRDFFDLCLDIERGGPRFKKELQRIMVGYVERKLGFRPAEKTKFFWGTGTAGLDAEQFMIDFSKDFSIDMSAFDGKGYGMEEGNIVDAARDLFKRLSGQPVVRSRYFTVDHLVEVLVEKKWFDPRT